MSTIQAVSYLRYTVVVLTDACTGIIHLNSGILSLKENVDALYQYLKSVS